MCRCEGDIISGIFFSRKERTSKEQTELIRQKSTLATDERKEGSVDLPRIFVSFPAASSSRPTDIVLAVLDAAIGVDEHKQRANRPLTALHACI